MAYLIINHLPDIAYIDYWIYRQIYFSIILVRTCEVLPYVRFNVSFFSYYFGEFRVDGPRPG